MYPHQVKQDWMPITETQHQGGKFLYFLDTARIIEHQGDKFLYSLDTSRIIEL